MKRIISDTVFCSCHSSIGEAATGKEIDVRHEVITAIKIQVMSTGL